MICKSIEGGTTIFEKDSMYKRKLKAINTNRNPDKQLVSQQLNPPLVETRVRKLL